MTMYFTVALLAAVMQTCIAFPDGEYHSFEEKNGVLTQSMDKHQLNTTLFALIQQNQLSPTIRYAGTGYNIIRGNPEGDFSRGGIDPGIRLTREVFALSYNHKAKVYYRGKRVMVPDQINFHARSSCTAQSSEKAISGTKSYAKELETSVSVLAGGSYGLSSFSFSLSAGMKSVKRQTEDQKSIIIQKKKQCNYGTVRYMYENAYARGRTTGNTLSQSFKNSVLYFLPKHYNLTEYARFIEDWGTHIIMELEVGTHEIHRYCATYRQVYSYLMKHKSLSTSGHASYGLFSFSSSLMQNSLNNNINRNTKLGRSMKTITIGTKQLPAPIHLRLKPITEGLNRIWWEPNEWKNNSIEMKRKNLMKALHKYPRYVNAHKNTDPTKITIPIEWPRGSYALPMAKSGCPNGWSKGWRLHDDENYRNRNAESRGIRQRMKLEGKHNLKVYFCVKEENTFSSIPWPRGSYCIAKKGNCPDKFRDGVIHWDDEDHRNKNKRWGILPDGRYNKNTDIQFCCRNDGSAYHPMVLPTSKPFYLYQYGGHCQKVSGMSARGDWIHWDDESFFNKDKCHGHVPDTSKCHHDIQLHYCYYHPVHHHHKGK